MGEEVQSGDCDDHGEAFATVKRKAARELFPETSKKGIWPKGVKLIVCC